MKKFHNKYRIPSARFINWDYGSNAPYFVTICTENKNCYFGEIHKGEIVLSPIGEIVRDEWLKTPVIRSDMNLFLDEFAIMPNHFHGIILIGENDYNNCNTHGDGCRDAMPGVSCTTYIGCYVQAPCLAFLQPFPGNWKIDARHGVFATT